MSFPLEKGNFHCYVRLPECIVLKTIENEHASSYKLQTLRTSLTTNLPTISAHLYHFLIDLAFSREIITSQRSLSLQYSVNTPCATVWGKFLPRVSFQDFWGHGVMFAPFDDVFKSGDSREKVVVRSNMKQTPACIASFPCCLSSVFLICHC